jgi:hypothetical protein
MRKYLLLTVALTSGCASLATPDDWTKADNRRQIAYFSALAADAVTTARIHQRPGLKEDSPIARVFIGKHPEPAETYIAAALLGLGHYWLVRRMKPERRKLLQSLTIAGHSLAARQNCDNGLC